MNPIHNLGRSLDLFGKKKKKKKSTGGTAFDLNWIKVAQRELRDTFLLSESNTGKTTVCFYPCQNGINIVRTG